MVHGIWYMVYGTAYLTVYAVWYGTARYSVQGLGYRVQGIGYRVQGIGYRI